MNFSFRRDRDHGSATTESPRFSSEEDFLEDCASDDLAEKERAVKSFLEKITCELSTNAAIQKTSEFLF